MRDFVLREATALGLLAMGIFYYICVFSYNPLDPSLSTSGGSEITNLGGILGSYLADGLFFIFGGGAYVPGVYFLVNAALLFTNQRTRPRLLDFLIFLSCTVFVAIFLTLQFGTLEIGSQSVRAGGSVGELFGTAGSRYLGFWGTYLFGVFGTGLTFVLATRLSLVEVLGNSTIVLGKGLGSLSGHMMIWLARSRRALIRLGSLLAEKWAERRHARTLASAAPGGFAALPMPQQPVIARFISTSPARTKPDPPEPKVRERKEFKAPKSTDQLELTTASRGEYKLPPLAFLDHEDAKTAHVDVESLKMNARILEKKLKDFAIDGVVTEIHPGPVITMYEFQPAPGIKLSRIVSLSDDLSLAMNGRSVRIVAPLPKKAAVGIEIPNHDREIVWLKDVIADDRFAKNDSRLVMALGKDTEGVPYVADLQKCPHLLVAGATGSGKSVSINTMITSILFKARPDEVRMIMIDPKMIELSIYQDIPHLLLPVVTDPTKANLALKWAVREMERRYKLLADLGVRHLEGYNKRIEAGDFKNKEPDPGSDEVPIIHDNKLPYLVIIIDEFADLMMVSSKEVEESVCRLAQKARAAGIHVILATQRPSVDVITGIIKANFPSRIAFKVTSKHDARTILDSNGAESLLGQGDMLFQPPGASSVMRMHGALISEKEIVRIVNFLKEQARPVYNEEILTPPIEEGEGFGASDGEKDEFYDLAVRLVCEAKRVSISSIQRQFRIGYNRAARLVEDMEKTGVVSAPNHQGQRQVLVGQI